GICSYLLIGFYYERTSASNAANKAFITNRVGDAGFIIGLLIIWTHLGTFNFEEMFSRMRAPVADSHGEELTLAGQGVRVDPEGAPESPNYRIAADGSEVLLSPRQPAHLHKDQLEHGKRLRQALEPKPSPKANQFGTMPYWMLVAAGLGIFLG